jgi:hypothetical protein
MAFKAYFGLLYIKYNKELKESYLLWEQEAVSSNLATPTSPIKPTTPIVGFFHFMGWRLDFS